MQQQIKEEKSIQEILLVVRKNIVLILVLIILGGCCGLGYSFIKKPNYIATASVVYKAGLIMDDGSVSGGTVAEFNVMRAYVDTVVDFCDEGVVVDRANYYYVQYKNMVLANPNYSFFEFLENFVFTNDSYDAKTSLENIDRSYILKEKISTTMNRVVVDLDQFFFVISYNDENALEARIKCRLVVESVIKETNQTENGTNKYFDVVYNEIIPLYEGNWLPSASSDVSKKKLALVGAFIGCIISATIVFGKSVLDSTVKSKEELEELTGATVLSVLEK